MKLFDKYNRVNLTSTIITFVVGSIAFYFVLDYVLTSQLDRGLLVEQSEIVDFVKEHKEVPEPLTTKHQWTEYILINKPIALPKATTTEAFNKLENEIQHVRQLVFTIAAGGRLYRVIINQSKTETEDLLQMIILVIILMIALILLSNYLINRKLVAVLWKPFYTTIGTIKDYRLAEKKALQLPREKLDEIDLLNTSLNSMTERIHQDYHALKMFTENASHEMQTPLAVIHSKVESLLQLSQGQEAMVHQLMTIEDATLKLSRLHQSLLLLAKLENRQFELIEPVNLTSILQSKLEERELIIKAKELKVAVILEEVYLNFHQHLAEIMINNLLNNVIRYTPLHGSVGIYLTVNELSIKNYSINGALDKQKLFQRFYKEEQSAESTGLGLAIVNEICTLAGFSIEYSFISQEHVFMIYFNTQPA